MNRTIVLLALVASNTAAADTPDALHLHIQERVAASGFPSGAIATTRAQLRFPLPRSRGLVFNNTFAGFGIRAAATPAFATVGGEVTLAPIDVFDVTARVSWLNYYGVGTGLLPYGEVGSKLASVRSGRADESVTGHAFEVTIAPTLKGRVGPVVLIDGWEITRLWLLPGEGTGSDFVYEPFRDLIVSPTDWAFEHQGLVLIDPLKEHDPKTVMVGPSVRHRFALDSRDNSIAVGLTAIVRPMDTPAMPTFSTQILWNVQDQDRVETGIPSMGLAVTWTQDVPLRQLATVAEHRDDTP